MIIETGIADDSIYPAEAVVDYIEQPAASPATKANEDYLKEKPKEDSFNEQEWSKAVEGLDYSKDRPAPPKLKQEEDTGRGNAGSGTNFSLSLGAGKQILLFGAVIVVLAFLLYLLIGGRYSRNTRIKNEKAFTVEEIEERMHESDLDKFLREALAKNDFRLAVRIYYLAVIKELSVKEIIRWKKDKTNREYLNEVVSRKPEIFPDFRDTTLAFEKVWYGDFKITEGDYMSISPRFRKFMESLGRLK